MLTHSSSLVQLIKVANINRVDSSFQSLYSHLHCYWRGQSSGNLSVMYLSQNASFILEESHRPSQLKKLSYSTTFKPKDLRNGEQNFLLISSSQWLLNLSCLNMHKSSATAQEGFVGERQHHFNLEFSSYQHFKTLVQIY